jgi:hypothetical protein
MLNPKRTRILPGSAEGLGYGVCVHNMVAPLYPLTVSRFSRDGGHPAAAYARRDAKTGHITVRIDWGVPHGGTFQTGVRSATTLCPGDSLVRGK